MALPLAMAMALQPTSSLPLSDLLIALNILFSAFIYLFDSVTTIFAAIDIYHLEKQQHLLLQDHNLDGIFIVLVCFIVVGHIGNALILFLTLPPQEQPVFQAYFLPLIQLWRLAKLVWLTSTCKGLQCLESEIKPLYNIISVSLETSHQLIIQLYVSIFVPPSSKLVLSLMVSFVSVAYNGGVAVLSLTNNAQNYRAAIAGGSYILSSFVLRSLSCAVLNASRHPYFVAFASSLVAGILINFVNLWFVSNNWLSFRWHKVLHYFAYGYLAFSVGPLYPMLREELEQKKTRREEERGRGKFRLKLIVAMVSHLSMDIILFAMCFSKAQKQVWWKSGCGHGAELLRHLKQPYWILYTGKQFCQIYVPRFAYGLLMVILSFVAFLVVDDWWSRKEVNNHGMDCAKEDLEMDEMEEDWLRGSEKELRVKDGSTTIGNAEAETDETQECSKAEAKYEVECCAEVSSVESWESIQTHEITTILIVYA